ncbi:MAG TPA: DUF3080 domain-containing protein [Rhodocyclaceae bacterium]|nr:DUF3080 domain-containing protein [Rhodocyclaceae bacterium]
MKLSRTLCCASVCVPLVACDPFAAPDSMLDEYVTRVGRVLDVEVALSPVPPAPALPRLRERTRPLPEFRVGMRDFLGLYGCGLQHVVGARNSGLGRVMHPSSRLEYELRFIRTADECLPRLERSQLADRLEAVTVAKREALADVAWNAVWGTREVEDLFTRSQGALRIGVDRNAVGNMVDDLRRMEGSVARVLGGELDVDVGALDAVYQRWLSQPLAGQVIRSALLLTVRLNDAAALVEARLGDRPLCHRKVQTRQAKTMRSMFTAVYVGHVQPYLADVQHVRRELLPPLQALARIEGEGHGDAFDAYLQAAVGDNSEGSHWQAFDRAVARHTRAWQQLLEQCGMRPGSGQAGVSSEVSAPVQHTAPAAPLTV